MQAALYRPEIDGLRTVAVLSVVFFHLSVPGFGGGFVGVDVFFVISGYLITRLIVDEFEATGAFQYRQFYIRRIRRLFPALFTTCFVSLIAGLCLLSPDGLAKLAESAWNAILSISNFYFWTKSDYFDAAAQTKPLLHTWSLSVEEQFYLVWPVALIALLTKARRHLLVPAIALTAAVSLGIAQFWLMTDASAAFYLLPARANEFMIGASVVWLMRAYPAGGARGNLLAIAGVGLIVLAIVAFTEDTPFPGLSATIPCLGTALVIYAGSAPLSRVLLGNAPTVAIGRWSYSIYLVHWPLFVFYSSVTVFELAPAEKALIGGLSIALGWLQYALIEQRFRYQTRVSVPEKRFAAIVVGFAAMIVLPSAMMQFTGGWKWRVPLERLSMSDSELRKLETETYCGKNEAAVPPDLFTCQNYRGKDKDIVIWGDSHAKHLLAGFSELYPDYNILMLTLSSCPPQSGIGAYVQDLHSVAATDRCVARNRKALAFLEHYKKSTIVVANAKRGTPATVAPPTNDILAKLTAAGHNVFVLEDFIRPGRNLINCRTVPDLFITDAQIEERCVGNDKRIQQEIEYNRANSALVARVIDTGDIQCPNGNCIFLDGSKALFRDDHHLSPHGSIYFLQRLKDRLPIESISPVALRETEP